MNVSVCVSVRERISETTRPIFILNRPVAGRIAYVESYMVIYAGMIIISFPSPTPFIPDLKPSFSANPSHCSLSFSSGLTT